MNDLDKTIGFWKGLGIAVTMVIGSGLLGLPGLTFGSTNIYESLFGWLLMPLIASPLIKVFSDLGMKYPSAAGISKYAEVAVGDYGRYIVTIIYCGTFTIGIPALSIIGGSYINELFGVLNLHVLSIIILILMSIMNLFGIKFSSILNLLSLVLILILVFLIVIFNKNYLVAGLQIFFANGNSNIIVSQIKINNLWKVCTIIFWAYLGWENLSFGLSEFKRPKQTIPSIYWISFLIVSFLYIVLATVSAGAIINNIKLAGPSGLTVLIKNIPYYRIVLSAVVILIMANANAWIFGASRLIYASGRDKILPQFLGKLSKKDMPANSIIVLCLFYVLFVIALYLFNIDVSIVIMLVSQNFIVLFGITIFAYWKIKRGINRWFISITSSISVTFLLSGFNWMFTYPVFLILLAVIAHRRNLKLHGTS